MSGRTVLAGGAVVVDDRTVEADVAVRDGRIEAVGPDLVRDGDHGVDVGGHLVAPGYLDLQVNGAVGVDVTSHLADAPERLWDLGAWLPSVGVTAFLPAVVSAPPGAVTAALDALSAGPPAGWVGAVPLGLHVEGPMLAEERRGTHDAEHLRAPDLALVDGWSPAAGVRMVTIAPELPGALEVIGALVERGVTVSLGHTAATYEQTVAGLDAGASAGTHLFNAMSGLVGRAPGAVGALLGDVRARGVGLIVDGVHVHPGSVAVAWEALRSRLQLVTDAVAATGLGDGRSTIGDVAVEVRDGAVRNADGALAGSVLTMDVAVANLARWSAATPAEAIGGATSVPADLLGDRDRGRVRAGARADLVVLTPDLDVVATYVGGHLAAGPGVDRGGAT